MKGPDSSLPDRIVLYDGVCGFCDASIQWLLEHDTERRLHFAALQGDSAARLRAEHPEIPETLESVVFIENGQAHLRSRAAMRIAAHLPGIWSLGRVFAVLPQLLTDLPYRLIARLRYRIWGTLEACRIPAEDEAARFLD